MAKVQVGTARVGAELDLQASAALQLLLQALLGIDRHGVPEQIFIHFLRCHNVTFLSCNLNKSSGEGGVLPAAVLIFFTSIKFVK